MKFSGGDQNGLSWFDTNLSMARLCPQLPFHQLWPTTSRRLQVE